MNTDRRKELKEDYNNRHPHKGIVSWKSGDNTWVLMSNDANADYNSTSFQLKLGSWPNKEMQKAYTSNPESFEWTLEMELDYKDITDDVSDDLYIMLMEYMDEHPEAKLMKPIKKRRY